MRKIHLLLIAAVSLTIFASCNRDKMPDEPTKGFAWYDAIEYAAENTKNPNPEVVYVGQGIAFVSTQNNADTYVVWPGEPGFAYADREGDFDGDTTNQVPDKSQGISLEKRYGVYSTKVPYEYDSVGDFTVTFVARNIYKNKDGDFECVETVEERPIKVIDTLAELLPPQGLEDKYDFVVLKPKALVNTRPVFDEKNKVATFHFPAGSDVTDVTLIIKAHTSKIEFEGAEKEEDKPTWFNVDLSADRKVTVSSLSGISNTWTVKTVFGDPSTEKELISFSMRSLGKAAKTYVGEISGTNIALSVPTAVDLGAVSVIFKSSDKSTVKINDVVHKTKDTLALSGAANSLKVIAQDGSETVYSINIAKVPTSLTKFDLVSLNPKVVGTIDEAAKTVTFNLFAGTIVTSLIPEFTVSPFSKLVTVVDAKETALESGVTTFNLDVTDTIKVITPSIDTVIYKLIKN